MSDWRLRWQEDYLSDAVLYKVSFPEFWERAYRDRNRFYQKLARYAAHFVEQMDRGHEYLEGDKVRLLWHEHCDFCWEKAMTDLPGTFYCTEDMRCWVCETCFHDFRDRFHWQEKNAEELLGNNEE